MTLIPAAGPSEQDPRPLYLIPYDPSVTQDPQESERCLKILLARGQAEAAANIGNSTATGTAVLDADRLLDKATYGISNHWEDPNHRRGTGNLIINFVKNALQDMEKHARTRDDAPQVSTTGNAPKRLHVLIDRPEQRQACADAIIGFPLPGDASLAAALHPELPFDAPPQTEAPAS